MSRSRAKVRSAPVNLFLLVFITVSPFTGFGQPFLEVTNFPGLFAGPLDWGDFDNDGRLDLFAAGWHVVSDGGWVPQTRVYRNLGGGNFAELSGTGLPDVRDADGMVGDYNKDGNVDVLLSGQSSGFVLSAFRNSGAGSFSEVSGLGPPPAFSVTWGDMDNDGDLDVSARNYLIQGSPSDFFRNAGNDSFVSVGDPLPSNLKAATWCDYDQDGFGDLLATDNPGSGNVRRLFHNNRDGTFTDIGASFAPRGSTAWGDFDNDGDPDLLIFSDSGNQIYRNDGSNIFFAVTLGLPATPPGSAIFGDFDNNGWLDVLVTGNAGGSTPVTKLFLNQNGASFTDSGLTLPGAAGPIRCADFDNDGDLDFAFTGTTTVSGLDPVFKAFRNDIVTKNPRPNPPTGLTAVITNLSTSLTLSWNPAFDTNQSGGHTYNLRLGTRPGASDILDPTADTSGFRRLVAPGNCGGRRSRTFTNLSGGVYYWSVQAIDHSYVGSPFAPEASFMLAKPTISDIPDQVLFPHIANSIPF
ncbi:MAG TPA: FG-GAP-like repeat-containing protein, partial [Verrucomicrobiae bacterium]|nr:FG-GAP-like repeat-containing protein [Verrucomicrobiae bacterium]